MNEFYKITPDAQRAVAALKAMEPMVLSFHHSRALGLEVVIPEEIEKAYVLMHGEEGQRFIDLLLGRTTTLASCTTKVFMRLDDAPESTAKDAVAELHNIDHQVKELKSADLGGEQSLPHLDQTIVETAYGHLESYKHALKKPYDHDWASSVSSDYWMLNSLLFLGNLANSGLSDEGINQLQLIERELGKVERGTGLVKGKPLFHLQLNGSSELLPIHHVEKLPHETGYSTLLSIQQWDDGGTLLSINDSLFLSPEGLSIRAQP